MSKRTATARPVAAPTPLEISVPLSRMQRLALETLARRSGLAEEVVVAHLLASGLFWTGLDVSGEHSFDLLLDAAVGKQRAKELFDENLSDSCWATNAGLSAADVEADERKAAHPDWFPIEAEESAAAGA